MTAVILRSNNRGYSLASSLCFGVRLAVGQESIPVDLVLWNPWVVKSQVGNYRPVDRCFRGERVGLRAGP